MKNNSDLFVNVNHGPFTVVWDYPENGGVDLTFVNRPAGITETRHYKTTRAAKAAETKHYKRIARVYMDGVHICSSCGRVMMSGYCIGDGDQYFCSDKCLYSVYTAAEYNELYDNGAAYWTTWEE